MNGSGFIGTLLAVALLVVTGCGSQTDEPRAKADENAATPTRQVGSEDGAPSSSAASANVRGPFLLVSLPSLGTVTWRCDPARQSGLALGFRAFSAGADLYLRLRAGGRTVLRRQILLGQMIRFPYLQARIQRLDFVQGTKAGTLRASVTVNFLPGFGYCWPYFPPRMDVRVLPRR